MTAKPSCLAASLRSMRAVGYGFEQQRALRWLRACIVTYLAVSVLLWATLLEASTAALFERVSITGWSASLALWLSLGRADARRAPSPPLERFRNVDGCASHFGAWLSRFRLALAHLAWPLVVLTFGAILAGVPEAVALRLLVRLPGALLVCGLVAALLSTLAALAKWVSEEHSAFLFLSATLVPSLLHGALGHLPSVLDLYPWLLSRSLS